MQRFLRPRTSTAIGTLLVGTMAACLATSIPASAQRGGSQGIPANLSGPYSGVSPDSAFAQIQINQVYLDNVKKHARQSDEQKAQDKELIDSGVLSALDLEAPMKAVQQYNRANTFLKAQNSKEALKYLQKAIEAYPKFVSAHVGLGLAYIDQDDTAHAKSEFDTAAKLDDKFPASFLNLGMLALASKDFATALSNFEKASSLCPNARNLSALAYAQNGARAYQNALDTAHRVHAIEHKGMANVHYVAAAAAMTLSDFARLEIELNLFLSEDPSNAFAPIARKNLAILAKNKNGSSGPPDALQILTTVSAPQALQTFPNSDRLKNELSALGEESDAEPCNDCDTLAEVNPIAVGNNNGAVSDGSPSSGLSSAASGAWTIRKSVDEVALFLAASSHGRMVNDLQASDFQIRDDNKPPEKVLQFTSQSKLPLRLALLVDTSGSVQDRFSFEKRAAAKFIEKVLNPNLDLGFITGFSHETAITQDFTSNTTDLGKGIDKLSNGGGTALFDAVSLACWKLAKYPDQDRVARVVVILSDGEDNSSRSTLKEALRVAERTGVTIYAVSTREGIQDKTDADRVLEALADSSGGEALFPGDMISLGNFFDKLRDVIRSRYFIAYSPANFEPDGSYRTINVTAEKNGKHLKIQARKGYHARLSSIHN